MVLIMLERNGVYMEILIAEKMLEELKLQEATCNGMGDELPDKMCLTSEQMKLIEEEDPGCWASWWLSLERLKYLMCH